MPLYKSDLVLQKLQQSRPQRPEETWLCSSVFRYDKESPNLGARNVLYVRTTPAVFVICSLIKTANSAGADILFSGMVSRGDYSNSSQRIFISPVAVRRHKARLFFVDQEQNFIYKKIHRLRLNQDRQINRMRILQQIFKLRENQSKGT